MSYVFRSYLCEACEQSFELMQHRGEGPPSFCPKCGSAVDDESEPVPTRIAIGGSDIAKSVDKTYRSLEESTAARAEMLGDSSIKVTDMHDNLREGDVAAKTDLSRLSPVMSGFMKDDANQGIKYGFGGGMSSGTTATGGRIAPMINTPQGDYVGPGHIALQQAQGSHERILAATKASGINTDRHRR